MRGGEGRGNIVAAARLELVIILLLLLPSCLGFNNALRFDY